MVDQERMKEYIAMGFDMERALELCQQEDAEAQKAAAKQAKIDAQANNTTQKNVIGDDKNEPAEGSKFITEDDLKKVVNETIENQIKEAKLKDATGNEGGDVPKERTVDDIMAEAVNRMRTGK